MRRLLRSLWPTRCPLCRVRYTPRRIDAHLDVDHFGERWSS